MSASLEPPRPGQTSLLHTARGPITLQTEITGDPAYIVTILDFRGRVLKSFKRALPSETEPHLRHELAKRWHATIEQEVRDSLRRRVPLARLGGGEQALEVVARLFLEAMAAYARRDLDSAEAVLLACDHLMPGDARVGAALVNVRGELRRTAPRAR